MLALIADTLPQLYVFLHLVYISTKGSLGYGVRSENSDLASSMVAQGIARAFVEYVATKRVCVS